MAGIDGAAIGEVLYQFYGGGGLEAVSAGEVGDGLEAWDVGVASEETVVNEPCDAARIVAGSKDGFGSQALPYRDFFTVLDSHDSQRIRDDKG